MFRVLVLACLLLSVAGLLRGEEKEADYQDELPRIPPVPLADALDTLEVAAGFRLEMVAHEPLVTDPVAMAFDEQGRLFVVEMRGYSERGEQRLGAVRMLTDTDADGTFDNSITYVDQLSWPTAICCFDGGVFIGVAPDILYCKDNDGDGRADIREPIFTGFGKSNVQGLLNSFQWGLDNRFHGATSSSAGNVRRPHEPAELAVSLRGRDFSFDPASLAWRPESGGGQHGLSFDRWGRKFNCTNSDHLRAVVVPDRYLARNPYYALSNAAESIAADGPQAEVYRRSPVEPWRTVRTRLRVAGQVRGPIEGGGRASGYFTSATGVTIYHGDAWPAAFRRSSYAMVGDVGSNIIHRKRVTPNGTSFRADRVDHQAEFVASSDIWFRPVQFCHGPDGALYVADFHREVIEHPDSLPPMIKRHLDLNSGTDRGRIYRIVSDDFVQPRRRLPGSASTAELVAMLEHANGWHRLTAARLLFERRDGASIAPLEQIIVTSTQPVARIHALWALDGIEKLTARVLMSALDDSHPRVREHAIILSEQFAGRQTGLSEKLLAMTHDADLRVRFQLALSLGEFPQSGIASALADLLRAGSDDPWMRAAVLSSAAEVAGPLAKHLNARRTCALVRCGAGRSGRRDRSLGSLRPGSTSGRSELRVRRQSGSNLCRLP